MVVPPMPLKSASRRFLRKVFSADRNHRPALLSILPILMILGTIFGTILGLLGALASTRPAAAQVLRREIFALRDSTQMLVVTTPEWNATTGVMLRYERAAPGAPWHVLGYPIGVVVGKNGLGWNLGAQAADPDGARKPQDPVKKEGDLRSPAGIFPLGTTFGYAPEPPEGWRMPYRPLTPSTVCVDDPESKFYNQIVEHSSFSPDWKSAEGMLRDDDMYKLGAVIEQNVNPPQPGDGSCIFLHIWAGPGEPTVGCTATAERQINIVLGWLDSRQYPVLVQLPAAKYKALEKIWGLPPLPKSRAGL